jgi:hypothetical protein
MEAVLLVAVRPPGFTHVTLICSYSLCSKTFKDIIDLRFPKYCMSLFQLSVLSPLSHFVGPCLSAVLYHSLIKNNFSIREIKVHRTVAMSVWCFGFNDVWTCG